MAKQPNDSESAHAALQAIWTHAPYMHQAHYNRCSQSCHGSLPCLDVVLAHVDSSSNHVEAKDVYAAVESASAWLCLPAVQKLLLWAPGHMAVQLWQCALVTACQSAHYGARDCRAAETFAALPLEQQREQQLLQRCKDLRELVDCAISAGADINRECSAGSFARHPQSALRALVHAGCAECVQHAITHWRADVNMRFDADRQVTALHLCGPGNVSSCIKVLVEAGADVYAKANSGPGSTTAGLTVLHTLLSRKQGANMTALIEGGRVYAAKTGLQSSLLAQQDSDGCTVLHRAVAQPAEFEVTALSLLLAVSTADELREALVKQDVHGCTVLHAAASKRSAAGHLRRLLAQCKQLGILEAMLSMKNWSEADVACAARRCGYDNNIAVLQEYDTKVCYIGLLYCFLYMLTLCSI
jgi:hypothetical protein